MAITTKHGSVAVGAIFFIASIAAGIVKGIESQRPFIYMPPFAYVVIEMMIIFIGIFSLLMAAGAVLEYPTMMFPWLAVILTSILSTSIVLAAFITLDKSAMLRDDYLTMSDILWFVGETIGIIVITSLLWAVVYHRYNRLITPKTTKTITEKSLDKNYKDMLSYQRFYNDNTA